MKKRTTPYTHPTVAIEFHLFPVSESLDGLFAYFLLNEEENFVLKPESLSVWEYYGDDPLDYTKLSPIRTLTGGMYAGKLDYKRMLVSCCPRGWFSFKLVFLL